MHPRRKSHTGNDDRSESELKFGQRNSTKPQNTVAFDIGRYILPLTLPRLLWLSAKSSQTEPFHSAYLAKNSL